MTGENSGGDGIFGKCFPKRMYNGMEVLEVPCESYLLVCNARECISQSYVSFIFPNLCDDALNSKDL